MIDFVLLDTECLSGRSGGGGDWLPVYFPEYDYIGALWRGAYERRFFRSVFEEDSPPGNVLPFEGFRQVYV